MIPPWSNNISSRFVSIHGRIQEFWSRVGDGGSRSICHKKISDNVFFFKSSTYFTEVQWFISKKINNFPRFQRGPNIFLGGGVSNFFSRGGGGGGASIAHSIKKPQITFVFPGVFGPLVHHQPLWIHACNIWINWMLWQKLDIRSSYQFWTSLSVPICIHDFWKNNHRGLIRIQIICHFRTLWVLLTLGQTIVFYLLH